MCGISLVLPLGPQGIATQQNLSEQLLKILTNRGPDAQNQCILPNGISCNGFVLWQQGQVPTAQPYVSSKNVLLFNGDIFNADKDKTISDTEWLTSKLDNCQTDEDIIDLLRTVEGPYSLIFYNKNTSDLYFLRDALGRNSLLLERNEQTIRIQSSSCISSNTKTIELPPLGIFKLNTTSGSACTLFPWSKLADEHANSLASISELLGVAINVEHPVQVSWSIEKRRIPLYNFSEILEALETKESLFGSFLSKGPVRQSVETLIDLIKNSVKDRVKNTPKYCSNCIRTFLTAGDSILECHHAKIGLLFSGGIDCTILAVIADEFVDSTDPIDLINVAFEPMRKINSVVVDFNVPDRMSARESFEELEKLLPNRRWNLIEINVNRDELQAGLKTHICHLIYPLETVLDESLGSAFWFAARGQGTINNEPYTTTSRVILVGSGADELFGGYTRHRNAYKRCPADEVSEKIKALQNELDLDWNRIPLRNLGRDDRIIADHGRTARAPFIEENFVRFVRQLHPLEICCFDLEPGIGDKLLLRLVGYKLGLRAVVQLKKRAIQFGSRVADKNQNAKDFSVYLKSQMR